MQVVAIASPGSALWHWRIVNYAGELVENSHATFPTIAAALGSGALRLAEMDAPDRSVAPRPYRSTSHLRGR